MPSRHPGEIVREERGARMPGGPTLPAAAADRRGGEGDGDASQTAATHMHLFFLFFDSSGKGKNNTRERNKYCKLK